MSIEHLRLIAFFRVRKLRRRSIVRAANFGATRRAQRARPIRGTSHETNGLAHVTKGTVQMAALSMAAHCGATHCVATNVSLAATDRDLVVAFVAWIRPDKSRFFRPRWNGKGDPFVWRCPPFDAVGVGNVENARVDVGQEVHESSATRCVHTNGVSGWIKFGTVVFDGASKTTSEFGTLHEFDVGHGDVGNEDTPGFVGVVVVFATALVQGNRNGIVAIAAIACDERLVHQCNVEFHSPASTDPRTVGVARVPWTILAAPFAGEVACGMVLEGVDVFGCAHSWTMRRCSILI